MGEETYDDEGDMWRLVVVALLIVGCATPAASPVLRTITGTFVLAADKPIIREAGDCQGTGGYDDIGAGVQVTVRDEGDKIIGTGRLAAVPPTSNTPAEVHRTCRYSFTVAGLPDTTFYSVEVSRRGAVTYSRAELEGRGWKAELTLGD